MSRLRCPVCARLVGVVVPTGEHPVLRRHDDASGLPCSGGRPSARLLAEPLPEALTVAGVKLRRDPTFAGAGLARYLADLGSGGPSVSLSAHTPKDAYVLNLRVRFGGKGAPTVSLSAKAPTLANARRDLEGIVRALGGVFGK